MEHESERLGFKSTSEYIAHLHKVASGKSGNAGARNISQTQPNAEDITHITPYFSTSLGSIYKADSRAYMDSKVADDSVDLIMTSPPFGLVRKKSYGNEDADEYVEWFRAFAHQFRRILKKSGSLVIDIGGAWKKGYPTRSLYQYELLITLCKDFGFHLAQEFYWWNPSRLPSPAEWVNIRRVRVKDAVDCVWWLSKTPFPKASNRRVLQPYSDSMQSLLKNGYKAKLRPSGHDISDKFQKDNGGAIPPNLIALANTRSNGAYQRYCRENGLVEHPARFPQGLPAFFVSMLTDPGDLVLDPFAGSCVTGEVAEAMGRKWVCCEIQQDYVEGAKGRFIGAEQTLFADMIGGRTEPYAVYPPTLSAGTESTGPLPKDGGRRRPKKK